MGSRQHLLPYVALVAVCFFWGTTYLGIRMALESFPPLALVAGRFLISGSLLLVWARWKGLPFPPLNELIRTCVLGFMLLGVANGCLTFSEMWIPSSMAALFLTTAPFWLVGIEALMPGGEKLTWQLVLGLIVGLGGVVLLILPTEGHLAMTPDLWKGFAILQIGSFFWNAGSIAQRHWRATTHPLLTGALQQFSAGAVYFLIGLAVPERPIHWTPVGLAGLLWLVIFGSLVGYSAYIYSLATLPISLVSIYTYINPVVAVTLGKLFYDEPFGRKEALAMAIIFAGVLVVKLRSGSAPVPSRPEPRRQSSAA